ncbi:hypothetical protein R3W88_029673 [Solanum pinnatisectum]|uniref:Uncharacterized protein n=1 Tax=Solanum pinnatisectum TaxID=50273 RepID=A0AAV9K785_9SOLN|nr:hypothetical protein R3W88_029673 [Solanum pinnatisectum]
MEPKSNNDPPPKVQYDRGYTPKLTFKISSSYPYTHQYSSPVEVEEVLKNEQHEEITRKMKSLEHNVGDIQALGGHRSVSFNDLCMLPHIIFPSILKLQKFLMTYFGESLMGIFSEWFIDQDISNWNTWDDLARCFV